MEKWLQIKIRGKIHNKFWQNQVLTTLKSDEDKEIIRLAAAKGFLNLASINEYIKFITPQHFHKLAFTIQDPSLTVRTKFASSLNKKLKTSKLPLNYLSIFGLAGAESNRSLLSTVNFSFFFSNFL